MLPIRLAQPGEEGEPFRDWLARRLHGNRRAIERMTVLVLQWSNLADETPEGVTVEQYATRWRTPVPTVHRLLKEYGKVFGGQADPGELHDLLWEGLSAPYLAADFLGDILDVCVVRLTDLHEVLPAITKDVLSVQLNYDGLLVERGTEYEAYEAGDDRFAWAATSVGDRSDYVSLVLERDIDDAWVVGPGPRRVRSSREDAEMDAAAAWALSLTMKVRRADVLLPQPVFAIAPGAKPPMRTR